MVGMASDLMDAEADGCCCVGSLRLRLAEEDAAPPPLLPAGAVAPFLFLASFSFSFSFPFDPPPPPLAEPKKSSMLLCLSISTNFLF
jgi:hypothetical protein